VEVAASRPHVQVWVGGVLVADTEPSMLLFQAGMPVRYYLPKLYARLDVLVPSATRTHCTAGGDVVYWSAQIGAERYDDIGWSHPLPVHGAPGIEDLIAFFNEKTDIMVDGVPQVPGELSGT
jgi:uncharacterized protein (DUF427 family)